MIELKDIESITNGFLAEHSGFYLVEASVKGTNLITVVIDHDSEAVGIDTVVALTRHIEGALDREVEDFELEVTSAGLTTPLQSPRRYRKFLGKKLEVLLKNGTKEQGTLQEVTEGGIVLEVVRMVKPEGERRKRPIAEQLSIAYPNVKRATYMIEF